MTVEISRLITTSVTCASSLAVSSKWQGHFAFVLVLQRNLRSKLGNWALVDTLIRPRRTWCLMAL